MIVFLSVIIIAFIVMLDIHMFIDIISSIIEMTEQFPL